MPNWCTNHITIEGEPRIIKMFEKLLREKPNAVFENLIGRDENVLQEDYDNGGWYSHNTSRFGTKWDIDFNEHQFEFREGVMEIHCETAWSPPTEFIQHLSEMYGVYCTMDYEEPGMDFAGRVVAENGDIIVDDQYDYAEGIYVLQRDYFWEGFLENQIEYWVQDEDMSADDVYNYFPFLSDDEKKEVLTYYNEYKERYEE